MGSEQRRGDFSMGIAEEVLDGGVFFTKRKFVAASTASRIARVVASGKWFKRRWPPNSDARIGARSAPQVCWLSLF